MTPTKVLAVEASRSAPREFECGAMPAPSTVTTVTDGPDDNMLAALCRRLGREPGTLSRFPDGSSPVYALGSDLVLKLYPPEDLDELRVEAAALRAVQGRLPIATPEVVHTGGRPAAGVTW